MKEIEQILTDYLKTEHTDFAIMINGDWGSGKTYYVKKTLFPEIKNIDSYAIDKKKNILKYEPLYVSLYGVSDINDVFYKVQLELNPWMKSKIWTTAKNTFNKLSGFSKLSISKDDEKDFLSIFNIQKNRVLFFDDLERIDKKLTLSSVLGQINHFTEQENIKVVIVCNNAKTQTVFNKINEKTVRFSCEYDPNLGDLYDSFIYEYKQNKYSEFLKSQKETVIKIFSRSECKNLRTLRFILDVFSKIYIEVEGKEYEADILARLFFFTTIYSVEYKTGRLKEELKELEKVSPYSVLIGRDIKKLISPSKGEDLENKEPIYFEKFIVKYKDIIAQFNYSPQVANYVHNGYLDVSKLNDEISEIQQEIKISKGTIEETLTNKIKNWRELPDDQFKPLIDEVYERIDSGNFSLVQYLLIFAEFLQFEHYELEKIEVTEDVIYRFKKGVDISKGKHKYIDIFRYKVPIWSDHDTSQAKEKYKMLYEYVIEANNYALSESIKLASINLIYLIKHNNHKELEEKISDRSTFGTQIFEFLNGKDIFEPLIKADNQTILAFKWGLLKRYPEGDSYSKELILKDRRFIEELQDLIDNYISTLTVRKISTVKLVDLNKNLLRIKNIHE